MRVLWGRVVAAALGLVALIVLVRNRPAIVSFLKSMENVEAHASPEEQTVGLVAFGLVVISVLALVKILIHERNDRRK